MCESGSGGKLRLVTYMVPGLPLGLYQVYQRYLEESLSMESYLMVESRWSGPPPNRDPFTADDVDIGRMYYGDTLASRHYKFLATVLFVQQIVQAKIKGITKALHYSLFLRGIR